MFHDTDVLAIVYNETIVERTDFSTHTKSVSNQLKKPWLSRTSCTRVW